MRGEIGWEEGGKRVVQAQEEGKDSEGDLRQILTPILNLKALRRNTYFCTSH